MSMKGNKVQPVRLTVENVDSRDDCSVGSSNMPGISLPRNGMYDSPTLQQRKKPRSHSYSGPAQNSGNGQGSNSPYYNANNQSDNFSNPHLRYARTLGYVSDTQSQTSFLSNPGGPQKLKTRARSFSGENRYMHGDDSGSNNNSRNGSRRPSVQPHGASLSRANSQKMYSSAASLSARKKRVTFRQPLVDDRMDSEASRKFSRSYTGSGNAPGVGFFGFNSRQNSQAKLNVDTNDDSALSTPDENVTATRNPSARGKNKGKNHHHHHHPHHHNNPRRENSFNSAKRNAGWAKWLGLQWIFSSANTQNVKAGTLTATEGNANISSTTGNNVVATSDAADASRNSSGDNSASPSVTKEHDDSVSEFSLPHIALETPSASGTATNSNSNSSTAKASAGVTLNSMIKNNNSMTEPNTPRSSMLLFALWMAGNNQSNTSSAGNATDKAQ